MIPHDCIATVVAGDDVSVSVSRFSSALADTVDDAVTAVCSVDP
jgi:hypothetical protein